MASASGFSRGLWWRWQQRCYLNPTWFEWCVNQMKLIGICCSRMYQKTMTTCMGKWIYVYIYSVLAEIEKVDLTVKYDFNKCKQHRNLNRKPLNNFCWCFHICSISKKFMPQHCQRVQTLKSIKLNVSPCFPHISYECIWVSLSALLCVQTCPLD